MSRAAIAEALTATGETDIARRWLLDWHDTTQSTQAIAATLGAQVGPLRDRWLLVAAGHQVAGRGRGGARWEAGAGEGVLLTLGAELDAPPARWPLASLIVGAALADAFANRTGADIRWKWPNDLLVLHEGRWCKLAGCLAERVERPGLPALWLVGVGLNRSVDSLPVPLRERTIGLRTLMSDATPTLETAIAEVAYAVRDAIGAWRGRGWRFEPERHAARLAFAGARIRCDLGQGETEGILMGLDPDGALLLVDRPDGPTRACLPLAIVGADVQPPWHPPARQRPASGSGGS